MDERPGRRVLRFAVTSALLLGPGAACRDPLPPDAVPPTETINVPPDPEPEPPRPTPNTPAMVDPPPPPPVVEPAPTRVEPSSPEDRPTPNTPAEGVDVPEGLGNVGTGAAGS